MRTPFRKREWNTEEYQKRLDSRSSDEKGEEKKESCTGKMAVPRYRKLVPLARVVGGTGNAKGGAVRAGAVCAGVRFRGKDRVWIGSFFFFAPSIKTTDRTKKDRENEKKIERKREREGSVKE